MAKGQQQGISSLTVWMILFVALWLTSTVLLVILYTNQEGLRADNARLQNDILRLIKPAERDSVTLFQEARKGGPTVVGLLEGARAEIARLATGNEGDDAAAVRTKLGELLRTIRSERIVPDSASYQDVSFYDALSMLYKAFSAERDRRRDAEARVTQLEAEVDQLAKASVHERSLFEKRAREISDQLADAEAAHSRYRAERDDQIAAFERKFNEHRKQSDADLTEERQRTASLEKQVAQFRARTKALQEKFGELLIGPQELATARQPDGRVLMAVPGDEVVFIDLGRKHRVVLGLRFAVYSAEDGIPADGRAKGQIEVVSIDELASECKIVGTAPEEIILEGDLIANPIYERHRSVGFVVLGEFDLDYDGVPDPDGAAAVESLITNWGGTLSTELNALTDFLVLGAAPRRPKSTNNETLPAQSLRETRRREAYERYLKTIETARMLTVPVLTQEVFLNFLGYTLR